jgi:hypothetical protein
MVLSDSGPRVIRTLGLPICFAVLATGSVSLAQTPSAEDRASARVLGTEGIRLADANNCSAAVPKLDAAEKLFHAPTTLDRLGECQIALGQIVAGTENLNRVVREVLPPNSPPAFLAAQKRAQAAAATAAPRIGTLRIHVDGVAVDQVTVTVDGAPVPSALFDNSRPTDPGSHEVKASAPGYLTTTATASLRDGADTSVSLHLAPDPSAQAAAPAPSAAVAVAVTAPSAAPPPPPPPSPPPPPPSGGGNGVAIGSLVVGGAGLALGSVLGVMALGTKSTLDSHCVNKVCPSSQQGNINSLGTQATISTIGFGVGIVGVTVGVILLAVSHGGGAASTGSAAPAPQISPWIGLGSAGVGGTFQ